MSGKPPVRSMGRGTRAGRWVGAVALVTVATLLAMVSVLAVFARNQALDTDRFVATMSPLARDPVVQDAIARRLTAEVTKQVDLDRLGREASAWLRQQGAPPAVDSLVGPAVNGAESFVSRQITAIVHSDTFAQAWDAAIRAAHKNLRAVLTGQGSTVIKSEGTTVSVDLGALIGTVKQRLQDRGFGLASKIPKVNVEFVLFSSAQLPKLRSYVTLLDTVATWLPWVALVLLALAVAVAPGHRRGLLVVGVFLAVGGLLLLATMAVLRAYYLNDLPPQIHSPDAVAHILDHVLGRTHQAYRVIVVLGALLAIASWLAGPARPAVAARRLTGHGLDAAGTGLARTGLPLGPVPGVLRKYHVAIDIAALVLALLGFVLTGAGVNSAIGFGLGLLALVLVVEVLARASMPTTPAPAPTPDAA